MDDKMDPFNIPQAVDPLDNYKLEDVIGKGSYGVVTRATKIDTNEQVAIKTVQCLSPENVELALEEFRSLSILPQHPNVVRLILGISDLDNVRTVIKHGDKKCWEYLNLVGVALKGDKVLKNRRPELSLVMDYCNGGDLNDYILTRPPNAALNTSVLEQLTTAVTFLHDHQVMHRDLKPENILIKLNPGKENEPQMPIIKIGDFGLAKVLSSSEQASNQHLYSACGSDFFMAPEVFNEKYNLKADVFSLGIIFWSVVDRITFKDSSTDKILLGTYVQKDGKILPMGEALNDDPLIAIDQLLIATSVEKKVIYKSDKYAMKQRTDHDGSTCFQGDFSGLRELICSMISPHPENRPSAKDLVKLLNECSTCAQSGAHNGSQPAPIVNRSLRSVVRAPPPNSPIPVEAKKGRRRRGLKPEVSTPVKTPNTPARNVMFNYRDSKDLKMYTSPVPPVVNMPQTPGRLPFTPNYMKSRTQQVSSSACRQCNNCCLSKCSCSSTTSAHDGSFVTQTPLELEESSLTESDAKESTSTKIMESGLEESEPKEASPGVESVPKETLRKVRHVRQRRDTTTLPRPQCLRTRRKSTRNSKEDKKEEETEGEAPVKHDAGDNIPSTEESIAQRRTKRKASSPPRRASKRLRMQSESSASESVVDKEEAIELEQFAPEPSPAVTPPTFYTATSLESATSAQSTVGSSHSQITSEALKSLWRPQLETSSTSARIRYQVLDPAPMYFHPPRSNASSATSSVNTTTLTATTSASSSLSAEQLISRHSRQPNLYRTSPPSSAESCGAATPSTSASRDVASTSRVVPHPKIEANNYLRSMDIVHTVNRDVLDLTTGVEVIAGAAATSYSRSLPTVKAGTNRSLQPLIAFTPTTDLDPRIRSNGVKNRVQEHLFKEIYTTVSNVIPKNIYTNLAKNCVSSVDESVSSYQLGGDERLNETTARSTAANQRVPPPPVSFTEPPPKPQSVLIDHYKARMEQVVKTDAQPSCSREYRDMLLQQAAAAATQNHQLFLPQHPIFQQHPLLVRTLDSHNNLQQSAINIEGLLRANYQQRMTAAASVNNLSSIYGPAATFYSQLRTNIQPSMAMQSSIVGSRACGGWSSPSLSGAAGLQFAMAVPPPAPSQKPNEPHQNRVDVMTEMIRRGAFFVNTESNSSALFNGPAHLNNAYYQLRPSTPFHAGVTSRHPAPLGSQSGRP